MSSRIDLLMFARFSIFPREELEDDHRPMSETLSLSLGVDVSDN